MKKSLSSVICLTVISLVITALLAVTNAFTAPIIEEAERAAAFGALTKVLPSGQFGADCEITEISDDLKKIGVESAYVSSNGGCVVTINTAGYSTGLKLMFGVDGEGKIAGSECLASSETLGFEKTYGENILGADLNSIDGINTVAGATKTTTAYRNAAKSAMQAAIILGGGTVDTRSEEEILNDNLNEILGTTAAVFTKWFKTADLGPVENAYVSSLGFVFESEGAFASTDRNGSIVNNASSLTEADIKAAYEAIASSDTIADVDFSDVAVSDKVTAVQKYAKGNYVITVKGSGFGKNGPAEYGISNEYIIIKVAVTPDGKILDCVTVSQAETEGIGSACADPAYYSQYAGKDASTLDSVDAIAGATFTSKGYKAAVNAAIESAKVLKEAGK